MISKNVLKKYLNPMTFEFRPKKLHMITACHVIKFDFRTLILAT